MVSDAGTDPHRLWERRWVGWSLAAIGGVFALGVLWTLARPRSEDRRVVVHGRLEGGGALQVGTRWVAGADNVLCRSWLLGALGMEYGEQHTRSFDIDVGADGAYRQELLLTPPPEASRLCDWYLGQFVVSASRGASKVKGIAEVSFGAPSAPSATHLQCFVSDDSAVHCEGERFLRFAETDAASGLPSVEVHVRWRQSEEDVLPPWELHPERFAPATAPDAMAISSDSELLADHLHLPAGVNALRWGEVVEEDPRRRWLAARITLAPGVWPDFEEALRRGRPMSQLELPPITCSLLVALDIDVAEGASEACMLEGPLYDYRAAKAPGWWGVARRVGSDLVAVFRGSAELER